MTTYFENKFWAEFTYNEKEKRYITRLYSPDDVFLASIHCSEDEFLPAAEGLMNGFFAGWRHCHALIEENVKKALNIDIITKKEGTS